MTAEASADAAADPPKEDAAPPPARWTLQVFARAPVEGEVKTRLIPVLGARGAAELHRRLMDETLRRACAARDATVQLWVAGDPAHPFVQECAGRFGIAVHRQLGADLGARMGHAFAHALDGGAGRCILIGCDCPAQTVQDLEQAAEALRRHELVLQPARDGGYVLLGLTRPRPQLLEDVQWGSARVTAQTLQRAAALGLAPHLLRALPDLDGPEDLLQARAQGWIDP